MTWLGLVLAASLGSAFLAAPARALSVAEAWRSPFGYSAALARDARDGSLWLASGESVLHLAADGTLLAQIDGLGSPRGCAAAPDGSCWVLVGSGTLVHLAADGHELSRITGYAGTWQFLLSGDGRSLWVSEPDAHQLVHLTARGTELWRATFAWIGSLAVSATDDSCWVVSYDFDANACWLVHLSASGAELWRSTAIPNWNAISDIAVNQADGSCWVALQAPSRLWHYAPNGTLLSTYDGVVYQPTSIGVSAADGSVWLTDVYSAEVARFAATGTLLWQKTGFFTPNSPVCNTADGSSWVQEAMGAVQLSATGGALQRLGARGTPYSVSADPTDNSCWAALAWTWPDQSGFGGVWHVGSAGQELLWDDAIIGPSSVSVNAADGTCWVADAPADQVVHLAANGSELWRGGSFAGLQTVAADPADGTCWASDSTSPDIFQLVGNVVRLGADGTELTRVAGFDNPRRLSVNPTDGSCWVADEGVHWPGYHWMYTEVTHLAADGASLGVTPSLWSSTFESCSVNTADGVCWATDFNPYQNNHRLLRLGADASVLSETSAFAAPGEISVNSADGSVWLVDGAQVVYLAPDGTELWRGGTFGQIRSLAANPGDGSCWVADSGSGQLVHLVVQTAPQADFSAWPRGGLTPLTVQFSDTSRYGATGWSWDFGDGATSTEQHPLHTYTRAGSFTVSLTASSQEGADTAVNTGYVTGLTPQLATRDVSFWATHPAAVQTVFSLVSGDASGSISLCEGPGNVLTDEDAMAVFWTTRGKRGQLAQQLLAAMCNDVLLQPAPDALLTAAEAALTNPKATPSQLNQALLALRRVNEGGRRLPAQGLDLGPADRATAQAMAAAGTLPECLTAGHEAAARPATRPTLRRPQR